MVTLYKARVTRVNIRVFGIEYKELFQSNFLNTRLISIDSQPKKIVVVVVVVIVVVVVVHDYFESHNFFWTNHLSHEPYYLS